MIQYFEQVHALRAEEKDAILDALLGMAWSDGEIHPDEVEFLDRMACFFTDKSVQDLLRDYVPDPERVSRKIGSSDLGPAGKRILLRAMIFVAAAEGKLDEKELSFYRGCVRAFGIPDSIRKRMEAEVHDEVYAELFRKAATSGELDASRPRLDDARKRLEIDEAAARDLERIVLREIGQRT